MIRSSPYFIAIVFSGLASWAWGCGDDDSSATDTTATTDTTPADTDEADATSEDTGPAETTAPSDPAYVIGDVAGASIGDALATRWALSEWSGQSDGPILIRGSAVSSLTADQQEALGEASLQGQVIAAIDVDQAQLDTLVGHLDIEMVHSLPRRTATERYTRAEVYAFDGQPNGETHYSEATGVDTLSQDLAARVVEFFAAWVETETERESRQVLGVPKEETNANLVNEAKSYGGTNTHTTPDGRFNVQVSNFIVTGYAFDPVDQYLMLTRTYVNVSPTDTNNPAQLASVDVTMDQEYDGGSEVKGAQWIQSSPQATGEPAKTVTSGINYSLSTSVGFSEGTNDSVSETVSVGATWVDTTSITVENLTIQNEGLDTEGFSEIIYNWKDPPTALTTQTVQHTLFSTPSSAYTGDATKLQYSVLVGVIPTDVNDSQDIYDDVHIVLPSDQMP